MTHILTDQKEQLTQPEMEMLYLLLLALKLDLFMILYEQIPDGQFDVMLK